MLHRQELTWNDTKLRSTLHALRNSYQQDIQIRLGLIVQWLDDESKLRCGQEIPVPILALCGFLVASSFRAPIRHGATLTQPYTYCKGICDSGATSGLSKRIITSHDGKERMDWCLDFDPSTNQPVNILKINLSSAKLSLEGLCLMTNYVIERNPITAFSDVD